MFLYIYTQCGKNLTLSYLIKTLKCTIYSYFLLTILTINSYSHYILIITYLFTHNTVNCTKNNSTKNRIKLYVK